MRGCLLHMPWTADWMCGCLLQMPWTVDKMRGCLLQMLGKSRFWTLWERIERSVAMTFVAALPRLHEVQAEMALPPQSCFQLFGLDYLIDEKLYPWLLEANATPSMKVEHDHEATRRMIHDEKWPVIRDLVSMLGISPRRFDPGRREHRDLSFMPAELAAAGGFSPLMHQFPMEAQPEGLRLLEWSKLDIAMRAFVRTQQYRTAASPAFK